MDFLTVEGLPPVVDQYDDNLALLVQQGAGLPQDFLTDTVDASKASKNVGDYALMVKTASGMQYRYPCMDRGNTLVSSMYFEEYGDQLPPDVRHSAAKSLAEASEAFGITPTGGLTKTASMIPQKRGPDEFLREMFGLDEDDVGFEEITDAFDGLSPRGKRQMALRVKTAGAVGEDYSGDKVGTDVYACFDARKSFLSGRPEAVQALGRLKEKIASVDPDLLADTLYGFDKKEELTHLYGRMFPDAYASVFGSSILKTAAPTSMELDGRNYSEADIDGFAASGKDDIVEAFGEEFYGQFADSPLSVMQSLPLTHKKALTRMMDARD